LAERALKAMAQRDPSGPALRAGETPP